MGSNLSRGIPFSPTPAFPYLPAQLLPAASLERAGLRTKGILRAVHPPRDGRRLCIESARAAGDLIAFQTDLKVRPPFLPPPGNG